MTAARSHILAIDTAMQGCSAAVMNIATGESAHLSEPMMRGQSERLVPMADEVIGRAGIAYANLALVAVTMGPGAFTGLRIGLSAARAWGTALDIPVAGLTTLQVLAAAYTPLAKGSFAVLIETKREDFYWQVFDGKGHAMDVPAAHGASNLAGTLAGVTALIGDGATRFAAEAGRDFQGKIVAGYDLPDPVVMARLGRDCLQSEIVPSAEPLYLREADVSKPKTVIRPISG